MMLVIPAIDLLNGKCVRLYQGSYTQETVYFDDPVKMAKLWRVQNARTLHIVDLNAAKGANEDTNNRAIIAQICAALDIPIQVGGGIRTVEDIEETLRAGAHRVVIGTAAVKNPELVSEAIRKFSPYRIVVGIDARDGEARIQGWTEGSGVDAIELAIEMEKRGCRRFVYTDISRDGTLQGPNIAAYRTLSQVLKKARITASGGISGYQDLQALTTLHPHVDSVIVGKALYENAFPCQQFWCWHDIDRVNLEQFSTAQRR